MTARRARRRGASIPAAAVLLVALAHASPVWSQLTYSPDVTVELSGTVVTDEDVSQDDLVGTVSVVDLGSLPAAVEVDAYTLDGTDRLFSVDTTTLLPGPLVARPADVVRYDGATYSKAFDALAEGVPDGANVDALAMGAGGLHLSFDTTVDLGSGVTPADEDLVLFLGGSFVLSFDGSAAGLDPALDLDAANVQPDGSFVLSFDHSGTIASVVFDDDTVIAYDGSIWAHSLDASDFDAAFEAADLVSVPEIAVGPGLVCGVALLAGLAPLSRRRGRVPRGGR